MLMTQQSGTQNACGVKVSKHKVSNGARVGIGDWVAKITEVR